MPAEISDHYCLIMMAVTNNISTPLDVRGLNCPEPFRVATERAMMLEPDDSFELLIGVEPVPLFEYLQKNGFVLKSRPTGDGDFLITITATEKHLERREEILREVPGCHDIPKDLG